MKRLVRLLVTACVLVAAGAGAAHARDVYLNGVKLETNLILKNQTFPACEVKFDDQGNVWITAKGFKIEAKPAETPPEPTTQPAADGKLGKRYWLVSTQGKRGSVQYDVEVYVNGTFVKKVQSAQDPVVLEVTKWVKPGENKAKLIATKTMGDKRASTSATDTMEIVLGEGLLGAGQVTIDKPLVTFKRNASETQGFAQEVIFTGR
jgi:hypothetical protein